MARKNVADAAKAKAEKQKKIAIGLVVVLAAAGAYAVHTMMGLNKSGGASSKPQVAAVDTTGTTSAAPAPTPAVPVTPPVGGALPTGTTTTPGTGSTQLIDSVRAPADAGQLQSFSLFDSKDPFNAGGPSSSSTTKSPSPSSGSASGSGSGSGSGTSKPPKVPPAPPTAPPTSAVISVNGTSETVATGSNFPVASPVFQLIALTASTAKVAVAGGSYASGASTLTLKVNTPVTLVNTADGTRYTLILLPQGTVASAPASASSTTPTTTTTSGG